MMEMRDAAAATGGALIHGNPTFSGVSTDTRSVQAGQLFVALRGERFDGHDFVAAALQRGAVAAMVERGWSARHPEILASVLEVDNTRLALGDLASYWRGRFSLPLIGITGSNGKTTVKEMCSAILRARAAADGLDPEIAVLATRG
ncbi:MAG: UDP-N-acetylmuramoyl-tripeptide--D-alanyl-D-alanine ligase, partial [Proteobacteria bacterium]|nr:UDP-N-acetylmuramoyl-tripeptide--D-alanyl-D-alanine ligase [Pseudomonadota bacterium]